MVKKIAIILLSLLGLGIIFYFLYTYFSDQTTTQLQDGEPDEIEQVMIDEKNIISMKTHVPIDQILEVEFGGELDSSTISTDNVSVFDEDNQLALLKFL